jgi:hypothetical protein
MNPSNPWSERKERDKRKGKKSRCEDKIEAYAMVGGNTRNISNVGPAQVKRRFDYCVRVPSIEGF